MIEDSTLPMPIATGHGRVSTVAQLAAIPEEEIWLSKQKSARTRRAYRLDVQHFMRTLHIKSYDELRQVDHRAVIAWERIMREIDMRDLTVALKKSSEPLKRLMLSNISRRAAASVQEEMAFLGHVKARDVEAAQFRIIDVVRKLEAEGEIEISGSTTTESEYEMV